MFSPTIFIHTHGSRRYGHHNQSEEEDCFNITVNIPDPFCSCEHRFSLHYPKCSSSNCNCERFVSAGQRILNEIQSLEKVE